MIAIAMSTLAALATALWTLRALNAPLPSLRRRKSKCNERFTPHLTPSVTPALTFSASRRWVFEFILHIKEFP